MNDTELFNRFALVSSVAAGASTFGAGLLLFAPRRWWGRAAVGGTAVGVMSGMTALLRPEVLGWVAGLGAAAVTVGVLVASAAVRRFVVRCVAPVCRPRVAGAAAVLAAGGLWGYEAWTYDRGYDALMDGTLALAAESTPPETAAVASAVTDCGTPIPLHSPTEADSVATSAERERNAPVMTSWSGRFIRRGAAGDDSNCHGWVFTGGRYNLLGRHVDTILSENGYAAVSTPAPGDVCVYRKGESVAHTALVSAVLPDGTVLVEGKWGRLGVYLHDVTDSCYGDEYSFYHTARGGHLLDGLASGGSVTAVSENVATTRTEE